jgi:NitT/TauT family transport system permease protein
VLSLGFTLVYGYWAAKDHTAERVLVPLLDILQSIPVLSFMPGLVLALVALFPKTNIGLELACVLMIFTGQAWNMTFSFYHSLRTIPTDQLEAATIYRFNWWQRFKWLELPFATMGLVWNSMMSMAGGWFFLMATEAFQLGDKDFRLPGIGSYTSVALDQGRYDSMFYGIVAMMLMIVGLDQLLWRPVVVWAEKFRVEEGGQQEGAHSWFLDWLRHSRLVAWITSMLKRALSLVQIKRRAAKKVVVDPTKTSAWTSSLSLLLFIALLCVMGVGAWKLVVLLRYVTWERWLGTFVAALWTLGRVLLATFLGTLWAVPAGLTIGSSPRLSRVLQPVVQALASFPAPMLFPIVILVLSYCGISLNWGSVMLMLLGTQWYILFNVIAGAMNIPADLLEAARSYRITGWQKFWALELPAIFPYLVTGWVTAAGGAWNASIVAEYVKFRGDVLEAHGLGAQINAATNAEDFPLLAASTLVMSMMVVFFNRTVWRRCYRLAEERFSLSK